jgi:hypothetical protein
MKSDELVKEKSRPPISIGTNLWIWNWWIGSSAIQAFLDATGLECPTNF